MQRVRLAQGAEAQTLSDLAIRSKAYWGYSEEDLELFRKELTLSTLDCEQDLVGLIERDSQILGFYKIIDNNPGGELDYLFVEPKYIGSGLGRDLFSQAISHARVLGISALNIVSDPNASSFYEHMGAERIDYQRSLSIAGRLLPILRIEIEGALENV